LITQAVLAARGQIALHRIAMAIVFLRLPFSQTEQWRRIGRALLEPFV
jgi:hypothetical protein